MTKHIECILNKTAEKFWPTFWSTVLNHYFLYVKGGVPSTAIIILADVIRIVSCSFYKKQADEICKTMCLMRELNIKKTLMQTSWELNVESRKYFLFDALKEMEKVGLISAQA